MKKLYLNKSDSNESLNRDLQRSCDSSDSNQNYYDNVLNSKLLNTDLQGIPRNRHKFVIGRTENGVTKLSNIDAKTIQPDKNKYCLNFDYAVKS